MSKSTGTIKWFSKVKGYGFIRPDDGGNDIIAHYSQIDGNGYRNLEEGDRVEFEPVVNGERGIRAENIRIIQHSMRV